jgi:hypothetical protein
VALVVPFLCITTDSGLSIMGIPFDRMSTVGWKLSGTLYFDACQHQVSRKRESPGITTNPRYYSESPSDPLSS